ncbi:MAG: FHA domain-containing protein [Myxococcota bacterium]
MSMSPQMPQLVEVDGPHAGRAHPLPYGEHVVGRGVRVAIRLDHEDVSRRHARLEVGSDGVKVSDLGSKNGVRSAGQRVIEPVILGHDERFSLGDLTLRIVHPASQVTRALAAGGETTVTNDTPPSPAQLDLRSLLVPLGGVLVFGTLVAVMLLR